MALRLSGGLDAFFEDLPVRLMSRFVLLIGLGGLWFAIRLTPDIGENARAGNSSSDYWRASRIGLIAGSWEP
jgi:hypothetical protein